MKESATAGDDRFCALPGGLRLCYREAGEGPPLLLVGGLGMPLILWPGGLVDDLVRRGYRVITYDNRDIGLSSRCEGRGPTRLQMFFRRAPGNPYDLADMAADGIGLIDHLGLGTVHVAGISMGGMIAQTMASLYPDRVQSLVSIFSTTGARGVGQPNLRMTLQLALPPARTKAGYVARNLATLRIVGGTRYPTVPEVSRRGLDEAWERSGPRQHLGTRRQIGAILKSGNRTATLARITAPTLVIHGDRDPLVHPSGGKATAAAIRDARFVTIQGAGHEIPRSLASHIAELIDGHVRGVVQPD